MEKHPISNRQTTASKNSCLVENASGKSDRSICVVFLVNNRKRMSKIRVQLAHLYNKCTAPRSIPLEYAVLPCSCVLTGSFTSVRAIRRIHAQSTVNRSTRRRLRVSLALTRPMTSYRLVVCTLKRGRKPYTLPKRKTEQFIQKMRLRLCGGR